MKWYIFVSPMHGRFLFSEYFMLLQPRDCLTGSTGESFVLSSGSSCPKFVSFPEFILSGNFLAHNLWHSWPCNIKFFVVFGLDLNYLHLHVILWINTLDFFCSFVADNLDDRRS